MHAFRAYVERRMEERQWQPRDLVQRSGLTRQLVFQLLHDEREIMASMPKAATMEGIARAFGVPLSAVVLHAARATGVPVDVVEVEVASPSALSDDDLVGEIRRRLARGLDLVPTRACPC